MSIHFISDTHFNHAKVILYSKRPFTSVEEMNEQLIKNWNGCVAPDDIIYHLGDFAFMKYEQLCRLLRRLNGRKRLIKGNHEDVIIKNEQSLLKQGLFESIDYYAELKINKQLIVMCHYAMRVWRNHHHGSIMLFGHSHGSLPPLGKSVDVGVDCKEITDEYRPVSLDEVLKYMAKREIAKVDGHEKRNHIKF